MMEIKKNYFYVKPNLPAEISYKAEFYSKEIIPHLPSPADLALITERDHYDVAATVFYNCLRQSQLYSSQIERFDEFNPSISFDHRLRVIVLSGDDYWVEGAATPGLVDLSHWVEDAGCEALPLHLHRKDSISRQALALDQLVREAGEKPTLILSFGHSALVVRMWLEKKKNAIPSFVKGWVLLSGSLRGSHLAENVLKKPFKSQWVRWGARLKGYSFEGLQEQRESYPVWRPVYLNNSNFRVFSVIGVPRWTEIHPKLMSHAKVLAAHGPSDGVNLLAHMIPHRGELYPLIGADYTLRQVDRGALVQKTLRYMAQQIF